MNYKITDCIDPFIFRGYDIRGVYNQNLDENVAYTIGKSFGTYVSRMGKKVCIIGHDNRYSSEGLTKALIQGIKETGIDIIFLGLVTTPMYYYACIYKKIFTGIMVTASHNPKDDNGFKFAFDERGNARGEMIQEFRQFTEKGEFITGNGEVTSFDIRPYYIELFKQSLSFGQRRVKVVFDCGNGTTTTILQDLLQQFPIDSTIIFGDSDPTFPNHHPDPCVEENLTALKHKVLEVGADLGIGFDGDGDRVGIIDEKGNYIPTDQYMIIIIRNLIKNASNKTFLYDVKCSKSLEDEIIKLGGTPLCYRTGNSYTKAKVLDDNLTFGGELSGHVYFNDRFPGFDSGIYAGLRLVELLSQSNKSVSEMLAGISKYYATEEIKIKTSDEIKFQVIDKVHEYAKNKGYDLLTIDGVKVLLPYGFALIRASNTGPNITARFEADTLEKRDALKDEFMEVIERLNKNS